MKKKTHTKEDLKTFDSFVTRTDQTGFDNYDRNIARSELKIWLENFSQETIDAMWLIIKDW